MNQFNQLAEQMAARTEQQLRAIMEQYTIPLCDLASRVRRVRVLGQPVETLYVDNVPVLELHDVEFTTRQTADSFIIGASQKYRWLR
jgi:hypothetical protein